jgi:hypothetical protein
LRYTFKVWLSLLLALTAASAYGQLPSIDPTAQIMWNLAAGIGPPTAACTQNGQYVTIPYGAQWGQHYVDQANDNSYDCGSVGWYQTNSGGVPNAQGTAPVTVNGESGAPKTGALTIACPSCGAGAFASQVVVPVVPGTQTVNINATSFSTNSAGGGTATASNTSAQISAPNQSGITGTNVTWSGFALPAGITSANFVSAEAYISASYSGSELFAGPGAACTVPSTSIQANFNFPRGPNQTFPTSQIAQPFGPETPSAAQIPLIVCTATNGFVDSSGPVVFSVDQINLIVTYTGTPIPNPTTISIAPPLTLNTASNTLGLNPVYNYGTSGGSSDAYTLSLPALVASLLFPDLPPQQGQEVLWTPSFPNETTSPSLNLNGSGAVTITKGPGHTALAAGDLNGNVADVIFAGSEWELQNPQTSSGGGSGITALTGPVTASGPGSVATTITPTGVTAGSYTNPNITLNAAGQVLAASNGSGASGITQLTGDATAGPGSGSQALTAVNLPGHIALTGTPSAGQVPTATSPTAATWQTPAGGGSAGVFPCDILASAGTPCIAAHSVTRRMLAEYTGNLFQLQRISDSTTINVGSLSSGQVNTAPITAFCAGTTCNFSIIYDQIGTPSVGNNLPQATVADQAPISFTSVPSGASLPMVSTSTGQFYRNRAATVNVPTGNSPITEYMVINNSKSATCCGTYGDVEATVADTGAGHMFSLAYSTGAEGPVGTGPGPWPGVDWENGVFLFGSTPVQPYLSILAKYNPSVPNWELKSGDATAGGLTLLNSSAPPETPDFEGGLSLGEGGDGSPAPVAFLEGVVVASTTSDAADNAVQANITSFYGVTVSSVFGRTGAVVASSGDYSVGQITGAAPLASPAFTLTPTAPTAAALTNTTQLATTAFVTAALAAAGNAAGIVTYSGPSLTFTGTAFFPIGGGGLSSTTETNVDLASPAAATVKNFTVQLSAAPGTGNSIAFTWRDNATSTAITCTVSGSATSCSDLTHSFTASAGDLLDIQAVTSGTILSASTAVMGTQVGIASSGGSSSGALTQIAQVVVSTTVPSITFSSIPGTFSSLHLVVEGQSSSTSIDGISITFNGDTGTDYDVSGLQTNGSSFQNANTHLLGAGNWSSSSTTNRGSSLSAYIPGYAGGFFKTVLGENTGWFSGNPSLITTSFGADWQNTAAITSITLTLASGSNFTAGTTATLYGMQ